MPKPRPGLAADPLAPRPRIAPVIPTTPVTEDAEAPADQPPAAAEPATGPAGGATSGGRRGAGRSRRTTADQPAPERAEDSVARGGPMSLEAGAPKKSYSFYVDPDLLEEARDTVVFLSADPQGPRTLSALIEEGLRREIVRLQDQLHDGEPFPHRRVALRRGGNTRDM